MLLSDAARRIVFFTPGLTEPGGVQRRSKIFVEGFADLGWDVKVVARAGALRRLAVRREEGVTTLEVPGFSSVFLGGILFLLVAVPVGIFWGFRAKGFIAVQLGSQSTAAAICGAVTRRPFLAFGSSTGPLSELRLILARRTGRLRRLLLRRAACLVAQTEAGAAEFRSLLPGARTAVVPTPVKPIATCPLSGEPNVLFVGRFSEEKDLLRLLDAWQGVTRGYPSARLTLAGTGGAFRSVEGELRRRVRGTLEHSVRFTGWVDDVAPLLSSHDIFVFPSLSEGMSNALLEAAAAKRVIVASDIAANRAVLGDRYPLLFAAGDTAALEGSLMAALRDEKVRQEAIAQVGMRLPEFWADRVVSRVEDMVADAYRRVRPPSNSPP
jgi:glycosyltransferase involved in cell wall biosynthesis